MNKRQRVIAKLNQIIVDFKPLDQPLKTNLSGDEEIRLDSHLDSQPFDFNDERKAFNLHEDL